MSPAPIVEFPFEEIYSSLDGCTGQERDTAIQGAALTQLVDWLAGSDLKRYGLRRLQIMGLRVMVLSFALRPELMGGSYARMARLLGVSPRVMSMRAQELVRRFGLVTPRQHAAGVHAGLQRIAR